jgi:hypothetical protein
MDADLRKLLWQRSGFRREIRPGGDTPRRGYDRVGVVGEGVRCHRQISTTGRTRHGVDSDRPRRGRRPSRLIVTIAAFYLSLVSVALFAANRTRLSTDLGQVGISDSFRFGRCAKEQTD